jgi:hypothetical protein
VRAPSYQTLMEGRLEFRLPARDRRLLDELVRQHRRKAGRLAPSVKDVLIPLIATWCRQPQRLPRYRVKADAWVHTRVAFEYEQNVLEEFANRLRELGERSASAVLRAIVKQYLDPMRRKLELQAKGSEKRGQKPVRRRRYGIRKSLAETIERFLKDLEKAHRGRTRERSSDDSAALTRLALWTAHQFVSVTNAEERRLRSIYRAAQANREFAAQLAIILGTAIVPATGRVSPRSGLDNAHR